MGLIKETFEEYKYAAHDNDLEYPPEVFMDFLPDFPEEEKPAGLLLQFKEVATPIL